MKKFYYFSKSKLKFVEIRNFYRKFVFLILFFSILTSFFVFGIYLVYNEFVNPDSQVQALKHSNKEYKEKFLALYDQFKELNSKVSELGVESKDLRLATNLEPLENNDFGIGGNAFESFNISTLGDMKEIVSGLDDYIGQVTLRVEAEKNNYSEIKETLKDNEILYGAIPAIRPATGTYGDSFGMRYHPILKIRRMHNGQDVITDIGTKVYAPGAGVVDFVGRRGGFGNTIEIDHGFGYRTVYGHLSQFEVKQGQKVKRGDLIALTGNSGKLSTGPHLHYEVRHNGIALDPRNFIYDDVDIFEIAHKE